ncbi:hypothetical protein [Streptomyces albireticuli]|uniref:Uncharacterized protein n=1 Tax=Streptomyces albireticuli TaxID=1940 RepID=A0A2A2D4U6_9ACTN|nr:hypothetical protein [Streptomyces albireticuli]MCD9196056.1 hypothetical protein [Streptomyces albireticuli]PAU46554.1 hypothetical protein CK936_23460 [Streptomyces albireticuli]
MTEIEFQPSGLASLRVARRVEALMPEAIAAVERHLGETVPPLTVVIAGRTGLATAQTLAAGWRTAGLGAAARYWWDCRQNAPEFLACTTVTRTDRIMIAFNSSQLRRRPEEIRATVVHEVVHAVQIGRPGRRGELQSELDHNLRIAEMPAGLRQVMEAVRAIEEAEAYRVEAALAPEAGEQSAFDRAAVLHRLLDAAARWDAAAEAAETGLVKAGAS